MLSSTASNYNMNRLVAGIVLGVFAVVLALVTSSAPPNTASSTMSMLQIAVPYVAMMFASSYVEEEQHFWYWVSSAWAVLQAFQRYVRCITQCWHISHRVKNNTNREDSSTGHPSLSSCYAPLESKWTKVRRRKRHCLFLHG